MRRCISYKSYLIRLESFQREEKGEWIPQYYFSRQGIPGMKTDFPSQQYQFNEARRSEAAADDFALGKAMEWIDKN